jgi:hypothetical protein
MYLCGAIEIVVVDAQWQSKRRHAFMTNTGEYYSYVTLMV